MAATTEPTFNEQFYKSRIDLKQATVIMGTALKNKVDKRGKPIYAHCIRVTNDVFIPSKLPDFVQAEWKIAAVLHDVVEDSHWTIGGLRAVGCSEFTAGCIDLLTHEKDETHYFDYILDIVNASHEYADAVRSIKLADLRDNMNPSRFEGLGDMVAASLLEKYCIAWRMLTGRTKEEFHGTRAGLPVIV